MQFYSVVFHRHTTERIEFAIYASNEDDAADIAAQALDEFVEPVSKQLVHDDLETLEVRPITETLDHLENL